MSMGTTDEAPTLESARYVMYSMIYGINDPLFILFGRGGCNTYNDGGEAESLKHQACVELCEEGKIVKLQDFGRGCTWGPLP
jgi:hypothetical protein